MNPTPFPTVPLAKAPASPWQWLRRWLLLAAITVTLVVLFYAEENWRGAAAWGRIQSELAAQGLPATIPALAPPPIPAADNLAEAPLFSRAIAYFRDPKSGDIADLDLPAVNRLRTVTLGPPGSHVKEPASGAWWLGQSIDLSAWQSFYRRWAATNALLSHGRAPQPAPTSSPDSSKLEIPVDLAARYGLATTQPSAEEFQRLFTFPVPSVPGTPANDVLIALEKIGPELEALSIEASRRSRTRFPITYEKEPAAAIWLPHLAPTKHLTHVLQLRATARLHSGATEDALRDILLSTRIAEIPAEEIFIISHLVRAAAWMILLQPVWEGIQNHGWTEAQLATVAARLESIDLLSGVPKFGLAEGICIAAPKNSEARRELLELVQSSDPQNIGPDWEWTQLLVLYAPRGWFHQNAVLHYRRMERELIGFRNWVNSPGMTNITQATPAPPSMRLPPYEFIMKEKTVTFYRRGITRLVRAESYRRLALVACALERHRLTRQAYPDTLSSLVPRYLNQVPLDPMSGQPLRYDRVGDGGFRLYSVGPDGHDDHGQMDSNPPADYFAASESGESRIGFDWDWPAVAGGFQ